MKCKVRSKTMAITILAVTASISMIAQSCSGTSFVGGGSTKDKPKTTDGATTPTTPGTDGTTTGNDTASTVGGDPVVPGTSTDDIPVSDGLKEKIGKLTDDEFNQTNLIKNFLAAKQDKFYIVTMKGTIYYYTMEGATAPDINDAKIVSKKIWSIPIEGDGGNRTYVTEGGLVIARSGGRVFWVDPLKTPEGPLDMTDGGPNYFQIKNVPDGHRGCPVSYKIGEKRYVGLGYSTGKFAIFTQDDTPPYKPNWATLDANYTVSVKADTWGYSCFIDQVGLKYYSAWVFDAPSGLDLVTKQGVNPAQSAPNGGQIFLGDESNGSYAMNGDRKGNVFNMAGGNGNESDPEFHYGFAGDIGKTAVWATMYNGKVRVLPLACLESGQNCANPYTYDTVSQLNLSLGPISALPSTGVIAASKFGMGVYFMRLKDVTNLAQGIEIKNMDTVDDVAYMYNDFTGATLYSGNADLAYDLKQNTTFKNDAALSVLIVSWEANAGAATQWQDLKLEIRCFSEGDFPPNFAEVVNMKDAGLRTFVQAGSCRNKNADKVELKVTQLNDKETIGRIKSFKVNFYQGN